MKLVDILARELTEWAGDVGAITQDKLTGELLDYYHCPLRGGNEREVSSIADDAGEAHDGASGAAVTRAEWQAAVDALNADKCEHSYANNIGCPECGELNAPKVVEWEQGDIPPISEPCEAYVLAETENQGCPMNRWISGKFIGKALADNGGITLLVECEDGWIHAINAFSYLRPVRTADQVAAEEREKAITLMIDESLFGHYAFTKAQAEIACKTLYESGYRKEPKPCGS